jgi:predicted O-linked N-acetylglucosamine transferase (SPINDLY family)
VSFLLAGLFENHDRERFETIAISLRPGDQSKTGARVRNAFERFIDVSGHSDAEIAALMHGLQIDIAVDLMGYTHDARTAIFARRPAPIQVNYLGFPGTLGADYFDYIIADESVVPRHLQHHVTENVVYLPDCFQGNDDRRELVATPAVRAQVGLPEAAFVFCSFNRSYKLNPPMFDIWMRLLKSVPGSVLWLLAERESVQRNLSTEAARRGVDPARLIFADWLPYQQHLARLRSADLFLDALPFNAGTAASDALWAGVPVLTCAGEAFASRMGASLLNALGMPELITSSPQDYERLA